MLGYFGVVEVTDYMGMPVPRLPGPRSVESPCASARIRMRVSRKKQDDGSLEVLKPSEEARI